MVPLISRPFRALPVSIACGLLVAVSGCGAANGWVMNNSGMGYYQKGQYAMAQREFAVAVAEAPWNPDYRHNLAMSLKRSGDPQRAEQILRHNLTLDAMHQPTYHSLAQLMVESGRQPEATELLQTWTATQPYNPKAHIEMAWLEKETGNLPVAEQELRQALRIEPNNAIALAHLGQIYQESGQSFQAAAFYQQSLAVNMNQPQVQTRLAMLGRGRGLPASSGIPGVMGTPQMTTEAMLASIPPATLSSPMMGGSQQMLAGSGYPSPASMTSTPMMSPTPMPQNVYMPAPSPTPMAAQPTLQPLPASSVSNYAPQRAQPVTSANWNPVPSAVTSPTATPGMAVPASAWAPATSPAPVPLPSIPNPQAGLTVPPADLTNWQPILPAPGAVVIDSADPAHTGAAAGQLDVVEPH